MKSLAARCKCFCSNSEIRPGPPLPTRPTAPLRPTHWLSAQKLLRSYVHHASTRLSAAGAAPQWVCIIEPLPQGCARVAGRGESRE